MGRRPFAMLLPLLLAAAAALAAEKAPAPGAPAAPAAPVAAPAAAPGAPAPAASFETLNIDLGSIPEGDDAVGTFVVKNTGKAELKLLQVKPG